MKKIIIISIFFTLFSCHSKRPLKTNNEYYLSQTIKDSIISLLNISYYSVDKVNVTKAYLGREHLYGDYGPYVNYGWVSINDSCYKLSFNSISYSNERIDEYSHNYYILHRKDSLYHKYDIRMWYHKQYAGSGSAFVRIPYDSCLSEISKILIHE